MQKQSVGTGLFRFCLPEYCDYGAVRNVIPIVQAMEQCFYGGIYVVDLCKKDIMYASDSLQTFCGYTGEEIKNMGLDFYRNLIPAEEFGILEQIHTAAIEFAEDKERKNYRSGSLSYDIHFKKEKEKRLVHHKMIPILYNTIGEVWLLACFVSLAGQQSIGHVRLGYKGERWIFLLKEQRWEKEKLCLTTKEKSILGLSAQGYRIEEIGSMMYYSCDSIKQKRRQLFRKLEVFSISEAIIEAINRKII